jgi:hypothetical protein
MIGTLRRLLAFHPFRGRLRGPEDEIALVVGSALRTWTLEGRLHATWSCIPHEVGAVSKTSPAFRPAQARYAKCVAQGLIAGSGDYVFVGERQAGWIELKSSTGSLSPDQRDFRDWCAHVGARYAVCRSIEGVETTLRGWGMLV